MLKIGAVAAMALISVTAVAEVIKRGPSDCAGVALTFDLCPVRDRPGFDAPLVDWLIERQVPATFFVSGRWAMKHDAELKKLLAVPFFEIGTHGQVHAHLPELNEEDQRREMEASVTLLRERYGRPTVLFRPPYGEYDERTIKLADALGLRFVLWHVISGDPDPALSRDAIAARVREQARRGSIIVFHANGKGRETKGVIEDVYPEFTGIRHWQPMTVSTLVDHCGRGAN